MTATALPLLEVTRYGLPGANSGVSHEPFQKKGRGAVSLTSSDHTVSIGALMSTL